MCRVHQLAPDILALRKGIEDAFPNLCRIEDRHVEHEQRIAGAPSAAACSTRVMPRSQTKSMNKLGDPASSAKLAALRARFARIVSTSPRRKPPAEPAAWIRIIFLTIDCIHFSVSFRNRRIRQTGR